MQSRILLFSRDPGGANALMPLVEPLEAQGFQVLLYGKDMALKLYEDFGLSGMDIQEAVATPSQENVTTFLSRLAPQLILTGTSADDATEKYLWRAAHGFNIPSAAVLDMWTNYGIRFSPYLLKDIAAYQANPVHSYLPDRIFVMDEHAKTEMAKTGISPTHIQVTGQPYFAYVADKMARLTCEAISTKKQAFGLQPGEHLITFISQPLILLHGGFPYYGYTERSTFQILLQALDNITTQSHQPVCLRLKLHPRESIQEYAHRYQHYAHPYIRIVVDENSDPWDVIATSDLICGMSSVMLIESFVALKPVISIQIGLNRDDPFILSKLGYIQSVFTEEALMLQLKQYLLKEMEIDLPAYHPEALSLPGKIPVSPAFERIKNPVDNIIRNLKEMLAVKVLA